VDSLCTIPQRGLQQSRSIGPEDSRRTRLPPEGTISLRCTASIQSSLHQQSTARPRKVCTCSVARVQTGQAGKPHTPPRPEVKTRLHRMVGIWTCPPRESNRQQCNLNMQWLCPMKMFPRGTGGKQQPPHQTSSLAHMEGTRMNRFGYCNPQLGKAYTCWRFQTVRNTLAHSLCTRSKRSMNRIRGGSMCNWGSQPANTFQAYSSCNCLQRFPRMSRPNRKGRSHSVQQENTMVRCIIFIIRRIKSSGSVHPLEGMPVSSRPPAWGVGSS
jgi:hypothetical protein